MSREDFFTEQTFLYKENYKTQGRLQQTVLGHKLASFLKIAKPYPNYQNLPTQLFSAILLAHDQKGNHR